MVLQLLSAARYAPALAGVVAQPSASQMHVDELDIDASLGRRLPAAQFPQWADLPIEPVPYAGTDNALYRLGDDMAVRLPRIHWATEQVGKEQRWLRKLTPLLPLAIPVPFAKGAPGLGYAWIGPSTGGSKAKTRPSNASPFQSRGRGTELSGCR